MSLARSAAPVRSTLRNVAQQSRRNFTTANASGINVAAVDDGAVTSTVTVAVKAGSRYDTVPGAAHILKDYLFKSNNKRSALRLIRESEFYGGVLSTELTNEHIFLTAEFLRGDEDFFVEVLGDVLTQSKFLPHEFKEEVVPQVEAEFGQAQAQPEIFGLDTLLQTAYRHRSLGHSLFASPASPVSYKQAVEYARAAFAKNNVAVVGSGIESTKLAKLVGTHFGDLAASTSLSTAAAKYFGGEQRVALAGHHGSAHENHFFVAFEGAGSNNASSAATLAVLRSLLGGESSVKWSKGTSPLSQIQGGTARAFNLSFSDAGLFGLHVTAPTSAAVAAAAKSAVNTLKSLASSVSNEQAAGAVAKAKFQLASAFDSRSSAHQLVGSNMLNNNSVFSLQDSLSALEKVNANSLKSAAEKILSSKPTSVAVGDVHTLPYADEIL